MMLLLFIKIRMMIWFKIHERIMIAPGELVLQVFKKYNNNKRKTTVTNTHHSHTDKASNNDFLAFSVVRQFGKCHPSCLTPCDSDAL